MRKGYIVIRRTAKWGCDAGDILWDSACDGDASNHGNRDKWGNYWLLYGC